MMMTQNATNRTLYRLFSFIRAFRICTLKFSFSAILFFEASTICFVTSGIIVVSERYSLSTLFDFRASASLRLPYSSGVIMLSDLTTSSNSRIISILGLSSSITCAIDSLSIICETEFADFDGLARNRMPVRNPGVATSGSPVSGRSSMLNVYSSSLFVTNQHAAFITEVIFLGRRARTCRKAMASCLARFLIFHLLDNFFYSSDLRIFSLSATPHWSTVI